MVQIVTSSFRYTEFVVIWKTVLYRCLTAFQQEAAVEKIFAKKSLANLSTFVYSQKCFRVNPLVRTLALFLKYNVKPFCTILSGHIDCKLRADSSIALEISSVTGTYFLRAVLLAQRWTRWLLNNADGKNVFRSSDRWDISGYSGFFPEQNLGNILICVMEMDL